MIIEIFQLTLFLFVFHPEMPDGANQEGQQALQQRLHLPEEQPQHPCDV